MTAAKRLVALSAAVFGLTGLGYLLVPGLMLAVVGVESTATNDFLIRTEGVALVCGAGLLLAVRTGTAAQLRLALVALAVYYVLGSVVDLAASGQGVVGPASVPSAVLRIIVGLVCLVVAVRLRTPADSPAS